MAKESSSMESEMRRDFIQKDDYYMGIAELSALRSKDPVTQYLMFTSPYWAELENTLTNENAVFFQNKFGQSGRVYAGKVGACIVNTDDRIVGVGYNGMPNKTKDEEMPWGKHKKKQLDNKYLYVCHATMNAIVNKYAADVNECRIYVTQFPCNECAKLIVQAGITKVIYKPRPKDKDVSEDDLLRSEAAENIFDATNVEYTLHEPQIAISIENKSRETGQDSFAQPESKKRKLNEELEASGSSA